MREIYKFPIALTQNVQIIQVDFSSRCLAFQLQDNELMLWVEVWRKKIIKPLRVMIFGTGWELTKDVIYVGTVQMEDFVWHLYREPYTI